MYQWLKQDVGRHAKRPRRFPDLESLKEWFDARQQEVFQERVERGLFLRMSDDDVEAARRRMPPPLRS
jgi:hypothetical protein